MVTSVTTINKSVVDKNGNVVSSLKPQVQDMVSVSHSHLGKADIMDLNLTAVNMYDDIGFARDSQIYKRDELRNTIIAAAVTTVYVAASVALAVVTFGSSALIQLSVTTALAAAAALAAIPSVYLGMKRGMDAVSVGDTQKAAMEFAFVALDFALLAGAWVQGIRFTNAFKAAGNTVHAGMATSEEMGKYSAHKAVKAAEAAVNANKAKAASRLAKAKQLLPNKVVRVDRYQCLWENFSRFRSNAFVRGVGTLLQSKAVNIAASLGVIRRNIVTANILEGVINRFGGSELTDTCF